MQRSLHISSNDGHLSMLFPDFSYNKVYYCSYPNQCPPGYFHSYPLDNLQRCILFQNKLAPWDRSNPYISNGKTQSSYSRYYRMELTIMTRGWFFLMVSALVVYGVALSLSWPLSRNGESEPSDPLSDKLSVWIQVSGKKKNHNFNNNL